MEPQRPEYEREQELHSDTEVKNYLYRIHCATVSCLFDRYELVDVLPYLTVSDVYANGETFCFVTSFDDDGDTCHQIYDYEEAIRIGLQRSLEREADYRAVQERQKKIRLVKEV